MTDNISNIESGRKVTWDTQKDEVNMNSIRRLISDMSNLVDSFGKSVDVDTCVNKLTDMIYSNSFIMYGEEYVYFEGDNKVKQNEWFNAKFRMYSKTTFKYRTQ